jgi:hypothetical protein
MSRLIFLLSAVVFAQEGPDVIRHETFGDGPGAWIAFGGAGLRAAPGGGNEGKDALALDYEIRPGQITAAILPVSGGLERMRRLRFWVKSDHPAAMGVLVNEKQPGGGNYAAIFWAPANIWQRIELTPADFALSDGPRDPKDANGKLDLDQINAIGILDLAPLFAGLEENPNLPLLVAKASGKHVLMVSDFEIFASEPTPRTSPVANTITIDAFDRGFLEWITLGGMDLKLSTSNPLAGPALEASFEAAQGEFAVLTRRISNLELTGAKHLAFDIASEREATLAVSLGLKKPASSQGPRFTLTIFPPAGRKVFHVNLSLDDFEHDQNSPAAKFDTSLLKSITLTDISAAAGGEGGRNTFWIGNVRLSRD